MALFGFGKKKEEEKNIPACCCGEKPAAEESCCSAEKPEAEKSCCCGEKVEGICCIKVLGAGCKSCHEQYEYAKQAVAAMGLSTPVEYITDMPKVMEYGVMGLPAIAVNEKVVSQGKVLKSADVEKLLHKLGF